MNITKTIFVPQLDILERYRGHFPGCRFKETRDPARGKDEDEMVYDCNRISSITADSRPASGCTAMAQCWEIK